ncbi:MAG: hypothetical protein ACTSRU_18825 [Candidatus Hodarchaeales archaeon]
MNLRKLLYLPNPEQTLLLLDDVEIIAKRYGEVGETERKEQKENQMSHDNRCPKCRGESDKIVDKIAGVEGQGNVGGNLFGISGRMTIETKPVNHCNVCNHEWEKFKTKTISNFSVINVILNYLSDMVQNPEHNQRLSWKVEAIKVFKGCYAESIYMLQQKNKRDIRSPLTLRQLRTKYKSVFDKEQP